MQVHKLTNLIGTCRKRLHHGLRLAAKTTIIIGIVDCREVILGHEMLSSIIYIIYQCIPLCIVIKYKIALKLLCIKIRCMTLQHRHYMGHHR
jgi:hypothetical protein